MEKVLFVGGFKGISKESGKPFYALRFVYTPDQDDLASGEFGAANPTIFVKEKVFNDFCKVKPMTSVNATIYKNFNQYLLINYSI